MVGRSDVEGDLDTILSCTSGFGVSEVLSRGSLGGLILFSAKKNNGFIPLSGCLLDSY